MGNDNVKDYLPYLDYPKPRKPITNADRIRAMTDEELAEKLCKMQCYGVCPDGKDWAICDKDDCQKCWIDWLKEEEHNEIY